MNTYHRHTESVISIGWLIRCGLLCLIFGAACVGYLYQKEALHHKAESVEKLERELRLLKRQNELKRQEYATLVSPKHLEEEVRRRQLDLGPPHPDDILSLPLPDPQLVRKNADSTKTGPDARKSMNQWVMDHYTRRYLP